MSFLSWILFGLIAGFIASKLVNKRGEGIILDTFIGIVGSFVGGFVFQHVFGARGVTGFDLHSLFVAVVGAVLTLVAWHAVRGSSS